MSVLKVGSYDLEANLNAMSDNVKDIAARRAAELIRWFDSHRQNVIAFSGGVDSTVVLAASIASGARTVAVTAKSPSVARWQLDLANTVASELGAEHRVIETDEVNRSEYRVNDSSRCFHCKSTLYAGIRAALEFGGDDVTVLSGTNADDLGDYRPGIQAGRNADVKTPLADLGIDKPMVRAIAKHFGLSNADLPASPCLASRIAYGVEVTPERLAKIESAESFLRERRLEDLRVRLHQSELARIEVPLHQVAAITAEPLRSELVSAFRAAGFEYITLDLEGFSSGSMNRPLVSLHSRLLDSPHKQVVPSALEPHHEG
ncbi:MAG: ATP-dependent sacrificial sulfur transferase LarE [Planctomycetota bacterium]